MHIETPVPTRHRATAFTPSSATTRSSPEQDLIATQIHFGLAYAQQAQCATETGHAEYFEVARNIAQDAYSAALRFAARFPGDADGSISFGLASLKTALEELPPAQPIVMGTERRRCIRRLF